SIHLVNGVLVYFLMLIILGEYVSGGGTTGTDGDIYRVRVLALFVVLLFITGPIQTHSVTYIIKRYAPMASFFYLLSLLLFIRAVDGHGIRAYAYAGSVLSFLFAIWCKETAYTAPVTMFLYYLCFIEDGWRASLRASKLLTPYLLLAAVSFYVSMPLGDERISPNWGRWEYLLTQSGVLIEYAKLLLLPIPGRLNVDYDVRLTETLWRIPALTAAVTIVAVLITAVLSLRRARLPAFCVLWFLVMLAPTSSIIPLPEIMVTYRLYLAGLAFYLLLVVGIHGLFSYLGAQKGLDPKRVWQAELAVLAGVVLFYGVCTYQHNKVWATEIALWEDTVKKSPAKVRPHYNLGHACQSDGQVERAKAEYKICVELYNSAFFNARNKVEMDCCGRAFTNLGDVYINEKQYKRAIPLLETAREISRYNGKAHSCLGMAYVMTGRLSEGEDEMSLALGIEPTDVRAHIGLGILYEKKDMFSEAITAYTNAVGADPANGAIHIKLGQLWMNHGNEPARPSGTCRRPGNFVRTGRHRGKSRNLWGV
ncbi:MAG: tetratricopeptide repeat protein, partial [Planctomycetota bacterium]